MTTSHNNLKRLPKRPAALIMDFDGVLTDNRVLVCENGLESVFCHRGDGMGLSMLKHRGFPLLVLSKERNHVVHVRCKKLGIPCYSSVDGKLTVLKQYCEEHQLPLKDVIYVGNDMNDVECLKAVGCGAVVKDAHESALEAADLVLSRRGGHGAVRELCDLINARLAAL